MDGTFFASDSQQQPMGIGLARQAVSDLVEAFLQRASERATVPPALAMRVSPGVGKTRAVLTALAAWAPQFLGRGHVLVHMPTLELAAEARSTFVELAPDVPSMVYRGRLASDETGPMCSQRDLVRKIQGNVPSLTAALCSRGHAVAPCHSSCRYFAQMPSKDSPQVIFLAHALIGERLQFPGSASLRIIDEKVWQTRIDTRRLALIHWEGFSSDPKTRALSARVAAEILRAVEAGINPRTACQAAGIGPEDLREAAEHERAVAPVLKLFPGMSASARDYHIETFSHVPRTAALFRAAVFEAVAEIDPSAPGCEILCLHADPDKGMQIELHGFRPLPRDVATLLIDADADPLIIERLLPGTVLKRIDVAPQAEILQITNRTLSPSSVDKAAADGEHGLLRQIRDLIQREAGRSAGPMLVIAPQRSLALLRHFAGVSADDAGRLWGADLRPYGPSLQGLNGYRNHATVLLLGRIEPQRRSIEQMARGLFGGTATPLVGLGELAFEPVDAQYLTTGGERIPAKVSSHPDPRCATLLSQVRECTMQQGLARLRLADPSGPKRVIIGCNVPLPDVPVTRLLTWEALCEDLPEGHEDVRAYRTLKRILGNRSGGRIRGLRLSAQGLAADAPGEFRSVAAAKEFRRGRTTEDLRALAEFICQREGIPVAKADLRRASGGRRIPALVFDGHSPAEIWPDQCMNH